MGKMPKEEVMKLLAPQIKEISRTIRAMVEAVDSRTRAIAECMESIRKVIPPHSPFNLTSHVLTELNEIRQVFGLEKLT